MKKIILTITALIIIFGVFINIKPEYKLLLGPGLIGQPFEYISSDGGFKATELLGKSFPLEDIKADFKKYQVDHPDAVLMRKFPKNYLKFWHWIKYWRDDRWDLPYYPVTPSTQ